MIVVSGSSYQPYIILIKQLLEVQCCYNSAIRRAELGQFAQDIILQFAKAISTGSSCFLNITIYSNTDEIYGMIKRSNFVEFAYMLAFTITR